VKRSYTLSPPTMESPPLSLHDGFTVYERQFALAAATMPVRVPWSAQEREEILRVARSSLGIHREWVPTIDAEVVSTTDGGGYRVEHWQSISWPGCRGAADLYLPNRLREPYPVVILACGHGEGGKRAGIYRRMAVHLVRQGMAVLVPDNIGQGERISMGHTKVVKVFEYGLSLQGLIVMETMGWLDWVKTAPRLDPARIAFVGNSGGGLLALFLGALCRDDLAAISSSGYPGTFSFIAQKEKKHCHCNLLPGVVGKLEMWQLYGAMAPTPLFLFQGNGDHFFPVDLFWHNARKVLACYERAGAATDFRAEVTEGGHSWDARRCTLLARYLCGQLGLPYHEATTPDVVEPGELPLCYPGDSFLSISTDEVARRLTASPEGSATALWEVFPPTVNVAESPEIFSRGGLKQIFSQYEAFLSPPAGAFSAHGFGRASAK